MNRRGFSLIELMLVVAITSIVVAGISIILVKSSQASAKQSQRRTLEETGRQALLEIASSVRLAGAGIDPIAAFDFDRYACTTPGTDTTCNNNPGREQPTPTAAVPGRRDRVDGPDELVVSYRDPTFLRDVTAKTGSDPYTVTIVPVPGGLGNGSLNNPIKQGRIAMLLCSGADPVSYVAFATDAAPGATTLTLRSVTAADGYYPLPPPTDGCFAKGRLALVERVRYFVANDFDGVPALFRDRGRAGDPEVLFRGIEDLQLTYQIGNGALPGGPPAGLGVGAPPACGGTKWVFGDVGCVSGTPSETATAPDWMNDGYDNVRRYTGHPANIRAVGINILARSTATVPDKSADRGDSFPLALANRTPPAADPAHPYTRSVLSITEQTVNLLSRAKLMPTSWSEVKE
jgi:prepilin-type N-terminal cleavage/methylation domain-containing protein